MILFHVWLALFRVQLPQFCLVEKCIYIDDDSRLGIKSVSLIVCMDFVVSRLKYVTNDGREKTCLYVLVLLYIFSSQYRLITSFKHHLKPLSMQFSNRNCLLLLAPDQLYDFIVLNK